VQAFSYRGTFLFCGLLALCALVLFAVPGYRYPLMWRAVKRFVGEQYAKILAKRRQQVAGRGE
jgi:SET family sugar efflux transporter-like MFS transporter